MNLPLIVLLALVGLLIVIPLEIWIISEGVVKGLMKYNTSKREVGKKE